MHLHPHATVHSRLRPVCLRLTHSSAEHEIQQQFGYYNPRVILKLLSIYSTALYGSSLWQLASEEHHKLVRSWNTAVKIVWDLPHSTHTRFLESLSPVPHLDSVLFGRYIGFIDSLLQSKKSLIRLVFSSCSGDLHSLTGQNLAFILLKYQKLTLPALTAERTRIKKCRVYPSTEEDSWKIKLIEEIALLKKNHLEINFTSDDLEDILEYICTS